MTIIQKTFFHVTVPLRILLAYSAVKHLAGKIVQDVRKENMFTRFYHEKGMKKNTFQLLCEYLIEGAKKNCSKAKPVKQVFKYACLFQAPSTRIHDKD